MAHEPCSIGPVGLNIPEGQRGTQNESTPLDQRVPDRTTEMSEGPRKGPTDNFLPSRYKIEPTVEVLPGVVKTFPQIIEDR